MAVEATLVSDSNPGRSSREKLFRHQHPQAIVLGNEFADELVQTSLKYAVHAAILKTHANASRVALRRTLATISSRD
jgi:hypothetical protein